MIKTIALKAVVKGGVIKPLEGVDLLEDKEVVVYIPEENEEAEEYSEWTDEEWQMMKHQEETGFAKKVRGNEKEEVWNAI